MVGRSNPTKGSLTPVTSKLGTFTLKTALEAQTHRSRLAQTAHSRGAADRCVSVKLGPRPSGSLAQAQLAPSKLPAHRQSKPRCVDPSAKADRLAWRGRRSSHQNPNRPPRPTQHQDRAPHRSRWRGESHDGCGRGHKQLVVQSDDLRPIGLFGRRGIRVDSIDGCLQLIRTGLVSAKAPAGDRLTFLDQAAIPSHAVCSSSNTREPSGPVRELTREKDRRPHGSPLPEKSFVERRSTGSLERSSGRRDLTKAGKFM